jgi:hypothetical protein
LDYKLKCRKNDWREGAFRGVSVDMDEVNTDQDRMEADAKSRD